MEAPSPVAALSLGRVGLGTGARRALPRVGRHPADGLEQLGQLRHRRARAGGEGQRRLHGRSPGAARVEVRGGGHPVVPAPGPGPRLRSGREAHHGRLRAAAAGPQPLPFRLQGPRRLRPCQGLEIRDPHHAWHPSRRRWPGTCRSRARSCVPATSPSPTTTVAGTPTCGASTRPAPAHRPTTTPSWSSMPPGVSTSSRPTTWAAISTSPRRSRPFTAPSSRAGGRSC